MKKSMMKDQSMFCVVEGKALSSLTTHQVAEILGLHFSSVIRYTTQGKLQCYRTIGGHRRFRVEIVREFMARNEIPTAGTVLDDASTPAA